jgi:hypothetical protein
VPLPTTTPPPATRSCLAAPLLESLGKRALLVGFSGDDAVASQASWDVRYQYIAGTLSDPAGGCSSASSGWWGCWQDWSQPPGRFVTDYDAAAAARGQLPMWTYYVLLPASGVAEGEPEIAKANDAAFMSRYLADWRFFLQKVGTARALLHVEPDFWGFAQHHASSPHAIPAVVASANPTDCGAQENSIAGLGRCMIAMARRYAPNAKVGLHASGWASGVDALLNRDRAVDVAVEARKTAAFLREAGLDDADFAGLDASDRDAGWYASIGQQRWWDATNATLPSFRQAFAWANAFADAAGKPVLWWQTPVGNTGLRDGPNAWPDNRVEYFFDHLAELAQGRTLGVAFGAGMDGQTTPSSDGGYLVSRVRSYVAAGGAAPCP